MINQKITKTALLLTLLVLLIGIASATTVTDNSTSINVVKKASTTQNLEVQKDSKRAIKKKDNNEKKH